MDIDRELLYRFFKQKATLEEEKKIRAWMEEDEAHYSEYLRERKLFDAILLQGESLRGRLAESNRRWWRKALLVASGVAAVVLLTIGTTRFLLERSYRDEAMNTVTVPSGQHVGLTLSDGTKVWLNSKTRMSYPPLFRVCDKRMVEIDGEAYFEVSKSRKPFVVNTPKGRVEVLGTKFYVKDYRQAEVFETSLVEGSVKVEASSESLTLHPRDKAVWSNGVLKRERMEDMEMYLWRDGIYCFKDLTLDEVLKQLEIYYDVRLVRNVPQNDAKLSGKFRLIDGVEYALRVLQKKVRFSFRRDEEQNVIYLE
ncbi:FecR family protein [Bacteroides heparinolyticus]|uniref:FecR family protein n=1 Tax=Prevotella heparinolytica TaxID=28113 RepID=UPI0023F2631F|nr:FecR domain-containing protein [Bacteroides heparinolyticus]MCI6213767.1 FecR domain-containing protein [Bacteroides heparinolyticus]